LVLAEGFAFVAAFGFEAAAFVVVLASSLVLVFVELVVLVVAAAVSVVLVAFTVVLAVVFCTLDAVALAAGLVTFDGPLMFSSVFFAAAAAAALLGGMAEMLYADDVSADVTSGNSDAQMSAEKGLAQDLSEGICVPRRRRDECFKKQTEEDVLAIVVLVGVVVMAEGRASLELFPHRVFGGWSKLQSLNSRRVRGPLLAMNVTTRATVSFANVAIHSICSSFSC